MNSTYLSLSIVIPAYNEAENIEALIKDIKSKLNGHIPGLEVIVVNDGSTDATGEICEKLARASGNGVRTIHHLHNEGYGVALRNGFKAARGELVFFTDADNQFNIAEIMDLLPYAHDYEIVAGYRKKRQDPLLRCWLSRGYNLLANFLLGTKVRDFNCAFKVFHRSLFDQIEINSFGYLVNAEIFAKALQMGCRIKEVPVSHFPRTKGQSKAGIKNVPFIAAGLLKLWYHLKSEPKEVKSKVAT